MVPLLLFPLISDLFGNIDRAWKVGLVAVFDYEIAVLLMLMY